jgi:hypothetical protein
MKINTFTLILSLLLAAIISYFLSSYQLDGNKLILGIGCFIGLTISGTSAFSISFDYERTTTLTRTVGAVFFLLYLSSQIFFALTNFILPTYVLVNGSLIIFLLLLLYGISKSKH